jgi:hypothetical protein
MIIEANITYDAGKYFRVVHKIYHNKIRGNLACVIWFLQLTAYWEVHPPGFLFVAEQNR